MINAKEMAIKVHKDEGKTLLYIDGDLTIQTVQRYKDVIDGYFVGEKCYQLDVAAVNKIDAYGLQLLLALHKHIKATGSELKVVSANSVVKDALNIARLSYILTVDELVK